MQRRLLRSRAFIFFRFFQRGLKAWGLAAATWAVLGGLPAYAQRGGESLPVGPLTAVLTGGLQPWQGYPERIEATSDPYERRLLVVELARAVERASDQSGLAQKLAHVVDEAIRTSYTELDAYPNLQRVHGYEEPAWLSDRGGLTAQAILALSALERWKPSPERAILLRKLAEGLAKLQRPDRMEYPFGAHMSWEDVEPMAVLSDGTRVPSTFFRSARACAVQALVEASQVLKDEKLLTSAEREALGMSTHLVIGGRRLEAYAPQPEFGADPLLGLAQVQGFLALFQATKKPIYADLAALTTIWADGRAPSDRLEWKPLLTAIAATPASSLLKAIPMGDPITSEVIQAEDGKVVNAPIETLAFKTPSGRPGILTSMGQENTFWMRFDVPTEDDYLFYLTYLQSDIGGGLVSVKMRIDGDKIFQVPLGDVDGRPIMRRKFVDGPRMLRAGPHSFGIRFSGLLMTKPALLDSVIVQPAIERREFRTPQGDRLVLMRNVTDETARTDRKAFQPWPPKDAIVVDGEGRPTKLGYSEDRRRRKEFLTLPAFGVALLRFDSRQEGTP